jgi:disulfide oxidoreductase YuzD
MKTFEDICYMTQAEVKDYMQQYLTSKQYKVINEDGFLYAKGTIPVLLVAHMDTVHKEQCRSIMQSGDTISSTQGIGGDDRCGVFIIANIVKELNCSVLLCEDEEVGGVGARKFTKTDYIKNLGVNYMIEFDRRGKDDAVFYSCDNDSFTSFVVTNTEYKKTFGSFSDISVLMPESKLCGVNLSCGYYSPHTVKEYVVYSEMMNTIEAAKKLINAECEKPFEYKEAPIKNYEFDYFDRYNPPSKKNKRKTMAELIKEDDYLEIEVVAIDDKFDEKVLYGSGKTKEECWMDVFLSYPWLCVDAIIDYSWC